MINDILLAFIPMFFAVDSLGNLAIFAVITRGLTSAQKNRMILQSLVTATLLAVGFILLGQVIFNFLGIRMGDFMIAGGLILFCLAMVDLAGQGSPVKRCNFMELAAVPIGTPLIVGPAVLTMALMLMNQYGWAVTLIAVLGNIAIVGLVFLFADGLIRLIGTSGSRVLSKVTYLLLAAIGVMMVRKGIFAIIADMK